MSDDAATEWLAVAANEVLGFAEQRPAKFRDACGHARRQCTHHGQIIPTVLSNSRYDWERKDEPFLTIEQMKAQEARQIEASPEVQKLITSAAKGCKP